MYYLTDTFDADPRDHCAMEAMLYDAGMEVFAPSTFNKKVVFVGREVSADSLKPNDLGVILARYIGTGGPVFFDENVVKFIFMLDDDGRGSEQYQTDLQDWVLYSLYKLGVTASKDGNDIYVNGMKVGGIGYREYAGKILLPFFLTLVIDYDTAEACLNLTKHGGDIRLRASGINDQIETPITREQLCSSLHDNMKYFFDVDSEEKLTTEILDADALSSLCEKFASDEWLNDDTLPT